MPSSSSSRPALAVVGGTYTERCQMPFWSQLFGSGLRAACAVSGRGSIVTLHTYVTESHRLLLASTAASFGVDTMSSPSPGGFEFDYRHSLSQPRIRQTNEGVYELPPLEVNEERVLAFGMLESNPVIHGERVVYDPQSPYEAVPFDQNGSEAAHLAIVSNWGEARKLSRETDIRQAGEKLLENCDVAVIKRGPHGAYVFEQGKMTRVPAFRTRHVFLIGSGDVFSASFAYAWAVEEKDPVNAANFASLATALYCQTKVLPISVPLPTDFRPNEVTVGAQPLIYLAGPFFSPQQLWMVEEARTALMTQGAKVFSPYHDVGFGPPKLVAQKDIEALEKCDRMFALLDGHDPGTVFEVGYARARGMPVTTLIASSDPVHLTMFTGTGCEVFHDFVSAIYNAVWS
jgi:nucleoside 2-deoxyribosyltransferase-like protein/pfkB family carbohydrate kinase